jgi:hypothetical protein
MGMIVNMEFDASTSATLLISNEDSNLFDILPQAQPYYTRCHLAHGCFKLLQAYY